MVDSVESLTNLLDRDMTARAAVRVGINAKRIEELVAPVREQEIKIYQKYGTEKETDQGVGWIAETEEARAAIQQEINELMGDDIELTILKISSTDIKCDLTPREVVFLDWLFDDIS